MIDPSALSTAPTAIPTVANPPPISCTIQDYDSTSDTCTVSLDQLGLLSTWLDGIAIARNIERSTLIAGTTGILLMTDAHVLCSATLIQTVLSYNPPQVVNPQSGTQRSENGRNYALLNTSGAAAGTITFPIAFSAAPTVSCATDRLAQLVISGISTSQFNYAISGGPAGFYVYLSWDAEGNA